jgi:hypothetical protein
VVVTSTGNENKCNCSEYKQDFKVRVKIHLKAEGDLVLKCFVY